MLGDSMDVEPLDKELNDDIDLNQKPDYVNYPRKDRDAYLSQVGNFSTEERGIFHLLCDNWDHEIGYAKFVTTINKRQHIDEKYLKSLMKKLMSSGSGLLLTKFNRGERGVDKLILTDSYSHHFYYYFINNEYQKNYEDVSNDYVDDKRFEKYDLIISELSTIPLIMEDLNKKFILKEEMQFNIFKVKIQGASPFYITSESLKDLIKISIRKVRYYFKSENFIAFIAKVMNSSISKVKGTVEKQDMNLWKDLTRSLLTNKQMVDGKFKNISKSFFVAVKIINSYFTNELKEKDRELEEERKIRKILREIVDTIKKGEFKPFTQEELNSQFDQYDSEATKLKNKFYESYVDNKTVTGLTEVVFVGKHYIHQDNLYKVFIDKLSLATGNLTDHFKKELRAAVNSNTVDPSLYKGAPFDTSILSKVQSDYPIVYDLIKRKNILAESIIHFSKKRGHSQSKMHNLLATYFVEGSSELKEIAEIFSLDIVELYELVYAALPFFKKLVIVLTGRYNRNLQRFTGFVREKRRIKKTRSVSSRSSNRNDYYPSSPGSYRSKGKSLLKDEPTPSNKMYSKRQRDSAWDQLSSEIYKKK